MNRRLLLPSLCILLPLIAACPSGEGALDTEGVGVARFGVDYNAQLGVVDYDGPARYDLVGELPLGLTMDAAGRILGTPEWAGVTRFEVAVSGLRGIEDFTDFAEIDVRFDQVEGAFIGVERTWLNNFFHDPPHGVSGWGGRWSGRGPDDSGMYDPWTRLTGTGVDGMHSVELDLGLYLPGPNERNDGGGLDDVRIGDFEPDDLTIIVDEWAPVDEVDARPNSGYPSGHYHDGDPPVLEDGDDGVLVFTAGSDTGTLRATWSHVDVFNALELRLQVSAPDWCPDPGC